MNGVRSNGESKVLPYIFRLIDAVFLYGALMLVLGVFAIQKSYAFPDRLISPISVTSDCFGCSIAFSGDTMVVGEPGGGLNLQQLATGIVDVYTWNGNSWQLQQRIQPADAGVNDQFGTSVDIQGDTLVIGSALDDQAASDDRGSVYVFTRSGGVWSQQQKLVPGDLLNLARFGSSVSISGETLLAGASGQPDVLPASQQIGTAYVYTRSGTTWTQQTKLDPSDGALQDEFGFSVDISGDTAVIGAPNGPTPVGVSTGTAYVYTRSGATWTFQSKLVGNLISQFDRVGESVALDGDTAILGSPFDDIVNVGVDAGSAYVFVRSGSTWSEQRKIIPTDSFPSTFFGNSVAIKGTEVAIASSAAGGSHRGFLYLYRKFGTDWRSRQQVASTGNAQIGESAALDGRFLASAGAGGGTTPGNQILLFHTSKGGNLFDYDGDGRTDLSLWRPSNGTWYIAQTSSANMRVSPWGLNGDKIVPADYDGDGKTDLAVRRSSDNNFYVFNSSNNTMNITSWGIAGDVAVPADYDGDGRADIAIWRPSDGNWYMAMTSSGAMNVQAWGMNGDIPAPGDFDGDGRMELSVFRPTEGTWYIFTIATRGISIKAWGLNGDRPVPGDYSGDGKTDFAVYRPSNNTWYRVDSNDGTVNIANWGLASDLPSPGDYDGDGRIDVAVWRPSDATWYVLNSNSGVFVQNFGLTGDSPTSNAFVY